MQRHAAERIALDGHRRGKGRRRYFAFVRWKAPAQKEPRNTERDRERGDNEDECTRKESAHRVTKSKGKRDLAGSTRARQPSTSSAAAERHLADGDGKKRCGEVLTRPGFDVADV